MSSASVFVHASRYETFGVVAAEALAAGMPIVATASGGEFEILGDDPSSLGAVVPVDDAQAFAAAVLDVSNGAPPSIPCAFAPRPSDSVQPSWGAAWPISTTRSSQRASLSPVRKWTVSWRLKQTGAEDLLAPSRSGRPSCSRSIGGRRRRSSRSCLKASAGRSHS